MERVFSKLGAECLGGVELDEARLWLLSSLAEVTGIPLEYYSDPHTEKSPVANTIHCTDFRSVETASTEYSLAWSGVIGSSDYRDDGILVFGAHLFPRIGNLRACLLRQDGEKRLYYYAYRYLLLTRENGWEDGGWHLDEYDEFSNWYCE